MEFLSEPELKEEQKREYINELNGLLGRIDWLINTLLKISKIDAGTIKFKKENVKLGVLIEKAYTPVAISMDLRSQSFVRNIDEAAELICDSAWTVEALENIIKNCMEHTPEGGTITVNASKNPVFTIIQVSDNGPGISEKDLPYIFKRFYKGKNSDKNSVGIGLALSQMIVTEQNGTIKAKNQPQGGAVFEIKFYHSNV